MAKPQKSNKEIRKPEKVELDPDAWPKFEALIRSAAKGGHLPHKPKKSAGKRA
jgi:hypothetical protein